jgi:copper chaperone
MPTTELTVGGMTCAHCERAVREAIAARDASARVEVDLAAGRVRADTRLPPEEVAAAIREAGYTT